MTKQEHEIIMVPENIQIGKNIGMEGDRLGIHFDSHVLYSYRGTWQCTARRVHPYIISCQLISTTKDQLKEGYTYYGELRTKSTFYDLGSYFKYINGEAIYIKEQFPKSMSLYSHYNFYQVVPIEEG